MFLSIVNVFLFTASTRACGKHRELRNGRGYPSHGSTRKKITIWMYHCKKGNYSGAIPILQDCVKKTPDNAKFHYHLAKLGLALLAAGQKETGKTQLQAALQMNKREAADTQQAKQTLGQTN